MDNIGHSMESRWPSFHAQVAARRSAGQLALLPMVLAGFPDRLRCARYVAALAQHGVALVEAVAPVAEGWAPTTNEIIRSAHRAALAHQRPGDGAELASRFAGTLKVLYAGNFATAADGAPPSPEVISNQLVSEGRTHSILQTASLPPNAPDPAGLGLRTTTMVSVTDPVPGLERAVRGAAMIVCKVADATGARLHDLSRIREAIGTLRSLTNVPIFCTFGISEPQTIDALRGLGTCDGAIVGTAILERLGRDDRACEALVRDLCHAAFD